MPEDSEKVVFYHAQDNDEKKKNKPFHLAWSGDGHEISKIFQENGVVTEWDGSDNKRIKVVSW